MKLQKLIEKFNQPDVHLVVSEWPSTDTTVPHHGVAAFTRETLITLARDHGMRFVVLSETNNENTPTVACHGKILVLRVFDHKHPSLYPVILSWLSKFSAIRNVTVHSEFGAHAGMTHVLLLLPFLALIKATGRQVSYVAHNVVDSLELYAPYLNITNDKYIHGLLSKAIGLYYSILGLITDRIITLDEQAHTTIKPFIGEKKLLFIPHWVKKRTLSVSKTTARKILGIPLAKRVILSFGFISWYKGSDMLAKLFTEVKHTDEFHLLFAGGKHVVREHKEDYQAYYEQFLSRISGDPSITYTGYLPDKKIPLMFAAADLVVLPYRGLMGGSGALSWAQGFGKPVLLSTPMRKYWNNPDVKQALADTNRNPDSFDLTRSGMQKILKTARSVRVLKQAATLSRAIAQKRNIHAVCNTFYNEVYAPQALSQRAFWFGWPFSLSGSSSGR